MPRPEQTRPAERYGDLRPAWHTTLARVLVATLAVLGLAWTAWAGLQAADRDVRWQDVGFVVLDPGTTQVTFDVSVYEGSTATCTVQALAANYAVVGSRQVQVDVGDRRTVREQVDVLTTSEAVSGQVSGCSIP